MSSSSSDNNGDSGMPGKMRCVSVLYTGKVQVQVKEDGQDGEVEWRVFDDACATQSVEVQLGSNQCLPVLEEQLASMAVGDKGVVRCAASLVLDKERREALGVAEEGEAEYNVEVVAEREEQAARKPQSADEAVAMAEEWKREGNTHYNKREWKQAGSMYRMALMALETMEKDSELSQQLVSGGQGKVNKLRVALLNNWSTVLCKDDAWTQNKAVCDRVFKNSTQVLRIDDVSAKALYRRGQVYALREEWQQAVDDLERAMQLAPKDSAIRTEYQQAKEALNESLKVF